MKTQIPIYRAKKIDSDEYVEGEYAMCKIWVSKKVSENSTTHNCFLVDQSTLAIHFPNMTDSEGTKIFASLSEDGNGGDIIEHASTNQWSNKLETKVARYDKGHFDGCFMHKSFEAKVTGIKK